MLGSLQIPSFIPIRSYSFDPQKGTFVFHVRSWLRIFPPQGLACDLLGPLPASVVPSSGAALLRGEGAAVFDGQLETLLRLERTTGGVGMGRKCVGDGYS